MFFLSADRRHRRRRFVLLMALSWVLALAPQIHAQTLDPMKVDTHSQTEWPQLAVPSYEDADTAIALDESTAIPEDSGVTFDNSNVEELDITYPDPGPEDAEDPAVAEQLLSQFPTEPITGIDMPSSDGGSTSEIPLLDPELSEGGMCMLDEEDISPALLSETASIDEAALQLMALDPSFAEEMLASGGEDLLIGTTTGSSTASGAVPSATAGPHNRFQTDFFQRAVVKKKNLIFYPGGSTLLLKVLYDASTKSGPASETAIYRQLSAKAPFLRDNALIKRAITINKSGLKQQTVGYVLTSQSFTLRRAFATKMRTDFQVQVAPASSTNTTTLASQINNWFRTNTAGRITGDVVQPRDLNNLGLFAGTALTIDGSFALKFAKTCREKFFGAGGTKLQDYVGRKSEAPYLEIDGLKATKVALKDDSGEVILIRAAADKDVLDAIGTDISTKLQKVIGATFKNYDVTLEVPKFTKLKTDTDLRPAAVRLGLTKPFTISTNGYRTMLDPRHELLLSVFKQVALLTWNANGFEGAAATFAAGPRSIAGRPPAVKVRYDYPYIAVFMSDNLVIGIAYIANPS